MNMESDEVEACSSTSTISEGFDVPETSQSWRSQSCSDLVSNCWVEPRALEEERLNLLLAQKIRSRRKSVRIIPKSTQNLPSTSTCDQLSGDAVTFFSKRKITTIHEGEIYLHSDTPMISKRKMQWYNHEPLCQRAAMSKSKSYKEKDAALKAIVNRLKKMANEKPEMLQDSLPDETIKLFKSIHIK